MRVEIAVPNEGNGTLSFVSPRCHQSIGGEIGRHQVMQIHMVSIRMNASARVGQCFHDAIGVPHTTIGACHLLRLQ